MCFYIKTKRKLKAKRDITCYKKINEDMTPYMSDVVPNIVKFGKYKFNYLYNDSKRKDIISRYRLDLIDIGFHSFIRKTNEQMNKDNPFGNVKLVKCIIPKGAYYYVNDTEYVSDQIIIIKEI